MHLAVTVLVLTSSAAQLSSAQHEHARLNSGRGLEELDLLFDEAAALPVAIRELAEQIKLLVAKGEIPLDHPTKVKELRDKLCALTTDLRKQQQQLISARDRDSEGVKGGRREVGLVK